MHSLILFVSLVNQVYHHFYHHILLLCFALSNHQGKSYEGIISQSFRAILTIKNTIVIQEPQEQRGSYALITIAKRVVLDFSSLVVLSIVSRS